MKEFVVFIKRTGDVLYRSYCSNLVLFGPNADADREPECRSSINVDRGSAYHFKPLPIMGTVGS